MDLQLSCQENLGLAFRDIFFIHPDCRLFFQVKDLEINSLQASKLGQLIWEILVATWFRLIKLICNLKFNFFGHCFVVLEPQKQFVILHLTHPKPQNHSNWF